MLYKWFVSHYVLSCYNLSVRTMIIEKNCWYLFRSSRCFKPPGLTVTLVTSSLISRYYASKVRMTRISVYVALSGTIYTSVYKYQIDHVKMIVELSICLTMGSQALWKFYDVLLSVYWTICSRTNLRVILQYYQYYHITMIQDIIMISLGGYKYKISELQDATSARFLCDPGPNPPSLFFH